MRPVTTNPRGSDWLSAAPLAPNAYWFVFGVGGVGRPIASVCFDRPRVVGALFDFRDVVSAVGDGGRKRDSDRQKQVPNFQLAL